MSYAYHVLHPIPSRNAYAFQHSSLGCEITSYTYDMGTPHPVFLPRRHSPPHGWPAVDTSFILIRCSHYHPLPFVVHQLPPIPPNPTETEPPQPPHPVSLLSQRKHSSLVNHRFLHTHTHPLTCLFGLRKKLSFAVSIQSPLLPQSSAIGFSQPCCV